MSTQPCGCDPDHRPVPHHCAAWPNCTEGRSASTCNPAESIYCNRPNCQTCGGPIGPGEVITIPAPRVGDSLMVDAWDLTTRDRHNQYGSAVDAFTAYGHIWTGLLAHKLQDGAVIDATDVAIMMTGLKLGREVRSTKRDNVVDAHGYLSLLARLRGWIKA